MKRIILVFFLINMSYTVAQTKTAILINSGLNVPISSEYFSKYWGANYNLGCGVEVSFNPQLSVLGYIDFSKFSFDDTKILKDIKGGVGLKSFSGGNINFLNFSANIKYRFVEQTSQKTFFYLLGGIGFANVSAGDLIAQTSYNSNGILTVEPIGAFSLNVGFCGEFEVSKTISIFADAKFIFAFTSGSIVKYSNPDGRYGGDVERSGSYILDYNTGYIPLRVGVSYSLP